DRWNFAAVEIGAPISAAPDLSSTHDLAAAPDLTTPPSPDMASPPSPDMATTSGFITDYYKKRSNGPHPPENTNCFPLGAWEQAADRKENGVDNAIAYKSLGINVDINGYATNPSTFATDGWIAWDSPNGGGQFGLDAPYSAPSIPGVPAL